MEKEERVKMTNQTNQIAIYEDSSVRSFLSSDNERTRKLAIQVQKFIPGIDKLPASSQWAFAAMCLAYDVDPLTGEAWAWMSNKGPTMMFGIAGRRRKAREMLRNETGNPAADFRTELTRVDSGAYGCSPDDFVYECRLYDDKSSQRWIGEFISLHNAGFSADEAEKIIGERPYTFGVGICRATDPTRMEKNEAARKRAEANALKQRFDLRFPEAEEIELTTGMSEQDYERVLEVKPEKEMTENEIVNFLGFDSSSDDAVIDPEPEPEEPAEEPQEPEYPEWLNSIETGNGEPYTMVSTEKLSYMLNTLMKQKFSDERELKIKAIKTIFEIRGSNQPAMI